MEKELKIDIPEGYEIDKENSTFECIRFKKKEEDTPWRDSLPQKISGYFIDNYSDVKSADCYNFDINRNVFNTFKQAQSALAMAQISQIIANDKRFGGPITDEEWQEDSKFYIIRRMNNEIMRDWSIGRYFYFFLAFHTAKQRDLFLKENEDLVKNYLMID